MASNPRIGLAATVAAVLLETAIGAAEAMPRAPLRAVIGPSLDVDQAAFGLHRRYPGYDSPMARRYRHARRLSPNRYCRNQPSRCR